MEIIWVIDKRVFFFPFFLLFFLGGCTPIGKVTEGQQTARATGPADPPGTYASPGTKLVLSPTSLSFATPDTTKTITVTTTDRFVHQKIFLCKTPCTSRDNWKEVGSFDGTPIIGTYLDGAAGISKQLALSRDDLMDGNNFIVVFTCGGIGLCNGNKWLLLRLTARFVECNADGDCSVNKKCEPTTNTCVTCYDNTHCPTGQKCKSATKTCVSCLADTDCASDKKCDTSTNTCVVSCSDGLKNQDETDIDCGGTCTTKCATDKQCGLAADCASKVCIPTQYPFVLKWGSSGSENGQFAFPPGIAVDVSDNIYVVDSGNARIQKFSSTGTFITKWGGVGTGNGQFKDPFGVAVDAGGNIYVADSGNARIQKFSSTGTFITKWGSYGVADGQFFTDPTGLAFRKIGISADAGGNVYVADSGNARIQKFSSTGTFITKWGSAGTGNGQFSNPHGISVDGDGNVYVVDSGNARIQKFSSTGAFITKWGSAGSGDGHFGFPLGIAVDAGGNYIADLVSHRIQKFTSSGTFITTWGSGGITEGFFQRPHGIAIDASGNIYVADTSNNRIQKFSPGMGRCAAPSCTDGIKNGAETDVDCGGVCADTTKCGGAGQPACKQCALGRGCTADGDCTTTKCDATTKKCVEKCSGVTCPAGKKCNPADGLCIDNCVGITCPTRQHCNPPDSLCIDDNPLFSGEPLLVAHWDMERIQNMKVRDVTGNGYEGTVPSEITVTSGKNGNALSFPGNKGMEITKSIGVRSDRSFSVEIMFKPAQKSGFSMLFVNGIVDHFSNTPPQPAAGYLVDLEDWSTGANPRFALAGSFGFLAGNIITGLPSLSPLPYTAWSHLIVTYNQPSNVITLYVNGNKITARTLQSSSLSNFNGPSYIGSRELGLDGFRGLIDDVKVYNGLLTDAMVKTHYTNS